MDHFGPWIFVVVIAVGAALRALRGLRGLAASLQQATADPTARLGAAEAARGRARPGQQRPPAAPRPPVQPPAAPNARTTPANVRTTSPTRRVPLGGTRAGDALPDTFEPSASPGGRALGGALANGPSLRRAIVMAELLAPPVALR